MSANVIMPRRSTAGGNGERDERVGSSVKRLLLVVLLVGVWSGTNGCGTSGTGGQPAPGAAPLRGFGIDVDQAISARVPQVHLQTCGTWGCAEQDVPLLIAGPTSTAPCPGASTGPDAVACGPVQLPGPGPGYGYAPVPQLTLDPVIVTVTTPADAPMLISAEIRVQPRLICPNPDAEQSACAGGTPQARLRIAADGTVNQTA
jgi:hypothetical protein